MIKYTLPKYRYNLYKLLGKTFLYDNKQKILDKLWIGDMVAAHDKKFLKENDIKLIINCTKKVSFTDLPNIHKIRFKIADRPYFKEFRNMFKNLKNITNIIKKVLSNKYSVLVHCKVGCQRSAATIAAYLIRFHDMTVDDTIKYIRLRRSIAFRPNPNFKLVLEIFQKEINKKK